MRRFSLIHVPGQSRRRIGGERIIKTPDKPEARTQTTNCKALFRRGSWNTSTISTTVRYQRGEPFVAIRALRSSAQLRPEEGGGQRGTEKRKEEVISRRYTWSQKARTPDISLRLATLSEFTCPALRPTRCFLLLPCPRASVN